MKILYTSILLLIISNVCNSQAIIDWQFDNAPAYNYYPTTNIINDGANTFVCSQSIDPLKVAYFFKLDNSGNLIAQDSIHNFDYSILDNKRMVRDNAGSYYLCGNRYDSVMNSKIRLVKYDSSLNRIWDISFIDSNTQTCTSTGLLFSQSENKIYLVGEKYDSTTRTIVLKYDTSGNVLWEAQDTLSSTYSLTAYTIDHSGNIILGGYAFINGFGTAEDFLVSKIDTGGSQAWIVRENGSGNSDDWVFDICTDINDNIYASGVFEDTARHKIFKYDQSGNRLWTRNIPEIGLNKIASDPAGSLYVVGYDSVPEHEFIIYKYDSTGNLIHSSFSDISGFNGYTQDYFVSIQTNDSGDVYLLHSADSSSQLRWLIVKLDSSLNTKWSLIYPDAGITINPATPSALCFINDGFIVSGRIDTYLRVIQFRETFPDMIKEINNGIGLTLWPNPVSENLFFQTNMPDKETGRYEIYDLNDRLILAGEFYEKNYSIHISNLKEGIYFLKVLKSSEIFTAKFIVHY